MNPLIHTESFETSLVFQKCAEIGRDERDHTVAGVNPRLKRPAKSSVLGMVATLV